MRFVIGVVLALSVGIGAYLGSARAAGSAKTPPRRVTLQPDDIAVAGQVQCRAIAESRQKPVHAQYLRCSKGPLSRAALSVDVVPGAVNVVKKVGQVQCLWEGPSETAHPIFSAYLECGNGQHHAEVWVEVQPGGIAVLKKGKIVYRTGWNPG
jgi:hypothetical protein